MKNISSNDLRELYQEFFELKDHRRIPSAPLVPENDPSVLFTTAGMHPLVPYLTGQEHPEGKRLTNAQKCLRTKDIDEVGDATHATVFEMLGNWSLGDYFKREAIEMSWEFLTSPKWLGIDPRMLAVSVFGGDKDTPGDSEAERIWLNLGVSPERIAKLGKEDNWWPAGGKADGPQGPDTEMFYWTGEEDPPEKFDPDDKQWVEIWNDVFMQFSRTKDGKYEDLPQKNVDTGMGLERVVMVLNGHKSIYDIDTFEALIKYLRDKTGKEDARQLRILADHIKAVTFVLGDEVPVEPSNTDQGYVARRLIRRGILAAKRMNPNEDIAKILGQGAQHVINAYSRVYPWLTKRSGQVEKSLINEVEKFSAALDKGMREFGRITEKKEKGSGLSGQEAFYLYESFGFPIDVTRELVSEAGFVFDQSGEKEFEEKRILHQNRSRTAAAGKFKGGLVDQSEASVKYHTATHLLHQALRQVLGDHVAQRGSNITAERLRFDFSHPEKMTPEQISQVETVVNKIISEDAPVIRKEMSVTEAKKSGALGLFESKYGEKVSVYSVGDFSKEICGGPHVASTASLGLFRVKKEESAGAGVRRIKAVLE